MRFKQVLSVALLATLLTAENTFGQTIDGGTSGGGGIGFCSTDKCVTLAQAGLRVPPEYSTGGTYLLPVPLQNEVRNFINALPIPDRMRTAWTQLALGGESTFLRVSEANVTPALEQYRRIVGQMDPQINLDNARVFALSNGSTTRLLPDFFRLNVAGQVLLLIHEASVRIRYGTDSISDAQMRIILQMDGELASIQTALAAGRSVHSVDLVPFLYGAYLRGFIAKDDLAQNIISHISAQRGSPLTWSELCGANTSPAEGVRRCNLGQNVDFLQRTNPRLVNVFRNDWLSFTRFIRMDHDRAKMRRYNEMCRTLNRADWIFLSKSDVYGFHGSDDLIQCTQDGRSFKAEPMGVAMEFHTDRAYLGPLE